MYFWNGIGEREGLNTRLGKPGIGLVCRWTLATLTSCSFISQQNFMCVYVTPFVRPSVLVSSVCNSCVVSNQTGVLIWRYCTKVGAKATYCGIKGQISGAITLQIQQINYWQSLWNANYTATRVMWVVPTLILAPQHCHHCKKFSTPLTRTDVASNKLLDVTLSWCSNLSGKVKFLWLVFVMDGSIS